MPFYIRVPSLITPVHCITITEEPKIFTTRDERGFLPYTPHPTPYTLFQVRDKEESRSFVLNFPRRIIE
ncbi:MAG: hypothetical protein O9295_08010 [Microcystis sp. LE18-22.4A]|jgi:hypothetical protein|nr:hypothetical protein [Microcystis sp. LE18-22.4A]